MQSSMPDFYWNLICHTDRNALYAHGDQEIEDEKMHDFLRLIEKRAAHIQLSI